MRSAVPPLRVLPVTVLMIALGALFTPALALAQAMGPLVVSSKNPRYFADPTGRAVFLAGAHTWNNLVDMDAVSPPRRFDYNAYLEFLQAHNLNFVRLWTWETVRPDDARDTPRRRYAAPQAWLRTGPGTDITGLPKFDLTKLNPEYFQRLRERVAAARAHHLYVSILLFEGWSIQFSPGRLSHPFYQQNNINHLADIDDIRAIDTLRFPALTQVQERYVTAVLDTVGHFDNVLFEIANEAGPESTEWQAHMIRFVKAYESSHGYLQHPVGMTAQHDRQGGGRNSVLFESEADWIAPKSESGYYLTEPQVASGRKVIVADTDHLAGTAFDDVQWAWRSFFRGLNLLYMDRYYGRDAVGLPQDSVTGELRAALGCVRLVAQYIDIGRFTPAAQLSSTGYALLSADSLLVYVPRAEAFEVDLRELPGDFQAEWLDTQRLEVVPTSAVRGGAMLTAGSSYEHGAILYLRQSNAASGSFAAIERQARSVQRASLHYLPASVRLKNAAKTWVQAMSSDATTTALSLGVALCAGCLIGLAGFGLRRRRQ